MAATSCNRIQAATGRSTLPLLRCVMKIGNGRRRFSGFRKGMTEILGAGPANGQA